MAKKRSTNLSIFSILSEFKLLDQRHGNTGLKLSGNIIVPSYLVNIDVYPVLLIYWYAFYLKSTCQCSTILIYYLIWISGLFQTEFKFYLFWHLCLRNSELNAIPLAIFS